MGVYIVDSMMGTGKSSAAINMINKSTADKRYIYITPYLDEVDRIKKACKSKNFKSPESSYSTTKLSDLKTLILDNQNIVSTHALFSFFNSDIVKILKDKKYILIMDEVVNVVEQAKISQSDLKVLLETYMSPNEKGILEWNRPSYTGLFNKYKYMCEMESLALYGGNVAIWMFPIKIFNAFKDIYVLTYMFNAQLQKYYFDYFGVQYWFLSVKGDSQDTYEITDKVIPYTKDLSKLVHIIDSEKLNYIGDEDYSLSSTWYTKYADANDLKILKKNCYNFFHNISKSKSEENIWTTFKSFKRVISDKGYTKGFVPLNIRATNQYQDTTAAAYLVNTYFNPFIKLFFTTNGIEVDEDGYALSELVQWIWRTQIRQGKEINLYIPSKRMRNLLQKWIKGEITC